MAETKELGPLFTHLYTYPTCKAPLLNWTTTQEVEPPYRSGRSVIIRWPGTPHGMVIGVWLSQRVTEDEALLTALTGRIVTEAGAVTADTLFEGDHEIAEQT